MISLLSIFLLPILGSLNSANFPDVLSPEEENKYLKLWQEKNMEARNVLIEHNLRLVAHIVKKFENTHVEKDDLLSIGTFGLIKAVDTYNFSSHVRLATYASRCIENEILMFFRNSKKLNSEVFLNEPIGKDKDDNVITLQEVLENNERSIEDAIDLKLKEKKLYEKMASILKPREREILILSFGLNNSKPLTQNEVANIFGISRSYVSRIETKAISKLAKEIKE